MRAYRPGRSYWSRSAQKRRRTKQAKSPTEEMRDEIGIAMRALMQRLQPG